MTRSRSRELLGPTGPLARAFETYEERTGQLDMADAVERALDQAHVLVCEAGTGTGKTLAYLVPAILSGQRVVISTATKALQEQIVDKDLPLIARYLGLRPRVALVKGLGNYLCLRRFAEMRKSASVLGSRELRRSLPLVEAWAKETETGDVAELTALGESDPLLGEVTSSSETRLGSACEYYDACFVTRMKQTAAEAEIIVVNHHLFFADVAVKLAMGEAAGRGGALPPYDAVIFDEAHQLEDVATDFFGVRLSESRVLAMLRDAERAFYEAGLADRLLTRQDGLALVAETRRRAEEFFRALARTAGAAETKVTLGRDAFQGELLTAYYDFDAGLETLELFAEANATRESVDLVKRRAAQARRDGALIVDPATNQVAWVEVGRRSVSVGASLVDVGTFLADKVLSKLGGVVMTSATLSTTAPTKKKAPPRKPREDEEADEYAYDSEPAPRTEDRGDPRFAFVRSRWGLDELRGVAIEELHVESPFDHPTRALLYLPTDLPEVTSPEFLGHAGERARALVDVAGGGAFVLSTSLRGMQALAKAVSHRGRTGPLVLVQGEAPKSALLARFREHGSAILVATMSFWEGVDVPGEALRMVVIDRIPFAVPTDPVVAARAADIEARGENPFSSYSVPQAAITLRQGFGRLLRAQTDRGVVAVLDRRLTTRGYGKRILESLPKARRTASLADVEDFFGVASRESVTDRS